MARHKTRMLAGLGGGAWMIAALPATVAQQALPLVSLSDGLHQVAKMKACQRLWNLHIAEEQSNTDPGGNLDLAPLMSDTRSSATKFVSSVVTVRFGLTTGEGREACGSFAVFASGGKSGIAFAALTRALDAQHVDIVDEMAEEEFNAASVGGQMDSSWAMRMQLTADKFTQTVIQQLPAAGLTAEGLVPTDLRMVIHDPVLLTGVLDKAYAPMASKARADLEVLYPSR